MMVVLIIISALVIIAYLVTMTALHGIGEYVSDYAYMGKHRWLFSVTMATSSISLLPVMMEKGGVAPFLALFAVFGLVLVGGEPLYKVEKIVSIALACWTAYKLLGLPKPYYWGEVVAFGLVYGTILI